MTLTEARLCRRGVAPVEGERGDKTQRSLPTRERNTSVNKHQGAQQHHHLRQSSMQLVASLLPKLPNAHTGQATNTGFRCLRGVGMRAVRCGPLHVPFTCQRHRKIFPGLPQVLGLATPAAACCMSTVRRAVRELISTSAGSLVTGLRASFVVAWWRVAYWLSALTLSVASLLFVECDGCAKEHRVYLCELLFIECSTIPPRLPIAC
ncbi:uncharacterized protein M421DRAFT_231542 [Didymella exigua CBS 183.55]|uniref:Uncharacterized protein n=1 Tax=Didymella exigua CBS 183.55 TaxID=1150837 RepID=A0A6A5RES6_9PLEO|nr:uncharacterized protein M421DRAFT_231542 [Didymella exigua CBS 183.55]KAF1925790.1 hypothetical protein M421DRAFT_231542 [Didymella exigua CBS 183.55]